MPATIEKRLSPQDTLNRRVDEHYLQFAAEQQLLEEIELLYVGEELTPQVVQLSAAKLRIFAQMGFASIHEICALLKRQRSTREMREQCGDPEKLKHARTTLADAQEQERATGAKLTAEITDLQQKLAAIHNATAAAEREVNRIEKGRQALRGRAPELLKSQVRAARNAYKLQWPDRAREQQLVKQIHSAENLLRGIDSGAGHALRFVNYCRLYLPNAVDRQVRSSSDGTAMAESVNTGKLEEHVKQLREGGLKELRAQHAKLCKSFDDETAGECERPIDDWVERGAASLA